MDVSNPPTIPQIFATISATLQAILFGMGPVLLVVTLVYAGYVRLTAADNPQKVKQSTQTIFWAIVGYGIVLGSFLIVRIAASILGYSVGNEVGVDL